MDLNGAKPCSQNKVNNPEDIYASVLHRSSLTFYSCAFAMCCVNNPHNGDAPYIHLNKEAASEELLQHLAQSLAFPPCLPSLPPPPVSLVLPPPTLLIFLPETQTHSRYLFSCWRFITWRWLAHFEWLVWA